MGTKLVAIQRTQTVIGGPEQDEIRVVCPDAPIEEAIGMASKLFQATVQELANQKAYLAAILESVKANVPGSAEYVAVYEESLKAAGPPQASGEAGNGVLVGRA